MTSTKCYRLLLKSLLNGKKIPSSPIFHKNKHVTDFKENSEFFNSFFWFNSVFSYLIEVYYRLTLLTENSLTSGDFSEIHILKIIKNQDLNKTHGHDMISICVLKLCIESVSRPLNTVKPVCGGYLRFLKTCPL